MKKRFLSLAILVILLISILPVYGAKLQMGENTLINSGDNTSMSGWKTQYIEGMSGSNFIAPGASNDMIAWQNHYITDPKDIYRIDKGEYNVKVKGGFWHQTAAYTAAYVKVEFYDEEGRSLGEVAKYHEASRGDNWFNLEASGEVPAGTRALCYKIKNYNGLGGRPEMRPEFMIITDEITPTLEALFPATANGSYRSGTQISYALKLSEPCNVVNGGYLKMNKDDNADYTGKNMACDTLYYNYTIPAPLDGIQVDAADAAAAVKPIKIMGVKVTDDAGRSLELNEVTERINPGDIKMDNKPPILTDFMTEGVSANSAYREGEKIKFVATFHEYVKVMGTPTIELSSGGTATAPKWKEGDTSTKDVIFTYTVGNGENSENLKIENINLAGILDAVGQGAQEAPTYAENIAAKKGLLDSLNIKIDTWLPYLILLRAE